MDFKEIKSKKLEREYECTLSNADVDQAVNSKLEIARENFQMKGFRKGHTPLKLMKKMFGKSTKGDVIQGLVDESLRNHLQKTGHKPFGKKSAGANAGYGAVGGKGSTGYDAGSKALQERFQKLANIKNTLKG